MSGLENKRCKPCEGGMAPLSLDEAKGMMDKVPGWHLDERGKYLERRYKFKGFYKTMGFVNAVAYIAQKEGHHPDMTISYNTITMRFTTHAIDGLSENDFICAAKVNALED